MPTRWRTALVCALLALAVALVYWPVSWSDFINYDDPFYVYDNPHVVVGPTWPGIAWAFTQTHAANWHPLTWLSHMLDCRWFGLNAAWHHLVSVLLHAANSMLVFLVLRALLSGPAPRLLPSAPRAGPACAAFVAVLFALHPLHVESVAWISERKDVLSTFFGLLSLWCYAGYAEPAASPGATSTPGRLDAASAARRPALRTVAYFGSLLFFALGLLSKPMLVTWPCLMLLLDFWPLDRLRFSPGKGSGLGKLLLEKAPFFALSAFSSVITIVAQRAGGAVAPLDHIPFDVRLSNAVLAYAAYLGKLFWPTRLAVIYPYDPVPRLVNVAAAALLLAIVSGLAIWQIRRRPYLFTGWAWFLGTLVPVIGLVQVGNQAMADRYTYIPAIGIFLMVALGGAELMARSASARSIGTVAAAGALVGCLLTAQAQVLHWQNTGTLFRHALAVTTNNFIAANDLGFYYADLGAPAAAKHWYRAAMAMNPNYEHPYNNLGCVLLGEGRLAEARANFETALQLAPSLADAESNLGTVLFRQGDNDGAIAHYRTALRLRPQYALGHHNLANVLKEKGLLNEAEEHYRAALQLDPISVALHNDYAVLLAKAGRDAEAAAQYREAIRLQPAARRARYELGALLLKSGQAAEAAAQFTELLRARPDDAFAHCQLAMALSAEGKASEAVEHYREALRRQPDFAQALNNLAWVLAAHRDAKFRDGAEAVRLAERACQLTEFREPMMIGTLAAAYAEAGRFPEAIATAERARALAEETHQPQIAERNRELLELYRAGQPCRDTSGS